MKDGSSGVWLRGERSIVVYFLDFETDRLTRFVEKGPDVGVVGGVCHRMWGRHDAWYVDPRDHSLRLRVAGKTYPLDGSVGVTHKVSCSGLASTLVVEVEGKRAVRVRTPTLARALLSRFDPGYDALDESMDDFFWDIVDVATSPERQAWILSKKSEFNGPWYLLD